MCDTARLTCDCDFDAAELTHSSFSGFFLRIRLRVEQHARAPRPMFREAVGRLHIPAPRFL